ncbi:hypothetical protein GCM10010140_08860 [Streptosporangium pseudovulgare]|uniref:Uncharacterized protein n=1 Tax=Streptosporangium pseudovulgare TaxID=35765 RepID=A0ABQ2QIB4_9ACTN|nr:hypothetical protein GCM10010140_08860 [Streptosporangium pseudovulgare]
MPTRRLTPVTIAVLIGTEVIVLSSFAADGMAAHHHTKIKKRPSVDGGTPAGDVSTPAESSG